MHQLLELACQGNLSLVERRLHALQSKADDHLFDDVVESYFAGHKLKPSVTGQAQIDGWTH
jgi:lipopolysaccharide/colanic/teichoic acid biosynthesis glycosyltransferase